MLEKFLGMPLVQRIVVGILVGVLLDIFLPTQTFISILGTLSVSCLKAVAPFLVLFSTVASVTKHKIGNKTFVRPILVLYLVGTLLSALITVIISSIFAVPITLQETISR